MAVGACFANVLTAKIENNSGFCDSEVWIQGKWGKHPIVTPHPLTGWPKVA